MRLSTPLRLSALLLLALAASVTPATADGERAGHAADALVAAPESGALPLLDDLDVSTATDTLPGDAATQFQALAGDQVRRVYQLRNDGLLPLVDISVQDPQAGTAIHCGPDDGTAGVSTLPALSWTTCSATFTAVAGEQQTTVTASATSAILHYSLSAHIEAGYTAVAPGLHTALSLGSGGGDLPANATVGATVTVTNTGSVELNHLAQAAPQSLSGFGCGSGAPELESLGAGQSAVCTGVLATAPGRQSVQLTIGGSWTWIRPITSQGPQSPRTLAVQAVAEAAYTGVLPPVTSPPSQQPRSAPSPGPTPAQTSPAAAPPSSTPTPTPTPSPPRSPVPTPSASQAVLAVTPPYPVSHGLPIPLKVLAIIIVPAIAVGRRAVSSLGRSS